MSVSFDDFLPITTILLFIWVNVNSILSVSAILIVKLILLFLVPTALKTTFESQSKAGFFLSFDLPKNYLTSVRVNFKLAPREGSRREPSLGAKTVKTSRSEVFTVLAFKIL
ncbi:MAG: hypothetical protein DCF19_06320 [Pseudanabaena frigida]|uniref:Uncharacterized protein n=1 Tax=Pseudanabaena frigida TaxID=945775 RepID=A0A2W4WDT2_9CYAN|nr:MAG: hypothetical protein DCF19_06320 [Pseudanabaena frigida]